MCFWVLGLAVVLAAQTEDPVAPSLPEEKQEEPDPEVTDEPAPEKTADERLIELEDKIIDLELGLYAKIDCSDGWLDACGLDPRMTCVSMGNPHVTLFCRDTSKVPLERVGPILETQRIFPRRINVHFVSIANRGEVTMRTWERGSGITWACGTGACAVCVAGVLTGRTARKILAHLPGGDLTLEWRESDGCVYMTGPAEEVFSGEWPDSPTR